ncbi:MAG: hypothetical protein SGI97_02610 [candidate division Zixibacteria bacterium]|nr:hypothetical protein [candidate division Zixibacteria bacterium]
MVLVSCRNLLILFAALTSISSCRGNNTEADLERHKTIAGELRDNKLFSSAIEEYQLVLIKGNLTNEQQGNINYLIGKIYFDDLKDYDQASAYYLRARSCSPEGPFIAEASKNLITALEKSGRLLDAKRELTTMVSVDQQPRAENDPIVARWGQRSISLSEIDNQIQSLPPEIQSQLIASEEKKNFLRQYVGVELLYDAALREQLDVNPEFVRARDQLVKKMLVDQFAKNKIMQKIQIDNVDIQNYYTAHRSDKYDDAAFESVRDQVVRDCQTEKAEAAYHEYINQLAQTGNVEFFEQHLR